LMGERVPEETLRGNIASDQMDQEEAIDQKDPS